MVEGMAWASNKQNKADQNSENGSGQLAVVGESESSAGLSLCGAVIVKY